MRTALRSVGEANLKTADTDGRRHGEPRGPQPGDKALQAHRRDVLRAPDNVALHPTTLFARSRNLATMLGQSDRQPRPDSVLLRLPAKSPHNKSHNARASAVAAARPLRAVNGSAQRAHLESDCHAHSLPEAPPTLFPRPDVASGPPHSAVLLSLHLLAEV